MLAWLARRRARNNRRLDVWTSVSWLLQFANERKLAALLPRKYPGLFAVIDKGQTDRTAPEFMAVQIVATMLSNEIGTSLLPERRRLVLDQLRHIDEIEGSPEEDALTARIAWAETIPIAGFSKLRFQNRRTVFC